MAASTVVVPACMAAASFLIGVAYLWETRNFPHAKLPVADALAYIKGAMATGSGAVDVAHFQFSRVYLAFLMALHGALTWAHPSLSGTGPLLHLVSLVQVALLAMAVGIAVHLAQRHSVAAAVLAGLFLLGYGPLYFLCGVAVPVLMAACLGMIALSSLIRSSPPAWPRVVLAALAIGVSLDLRPHFFAVLPVAVALAGRGVDGWRTKAVRWTLTLAATALPAAGVAGWTWVASGQEVVPVRASLGWNLYLGNNPSANGTYKPIEGLDCDPGAYETTAREVAESETGRSLTTGGVNAFWAKRAAAFAWERPVAEAKLLGRKLQHVISSKEFPLNYDYVVHRSLSWILRALPVSFGLIGALALFGVLFRRQYEQVGPIYAWFVSYGASLLLFFVTSEHRLPLVFAAAILAAVVVVEVFRMASASRWWAFSLLSLAILATTTVGQFDPVTWQHHHTYYQMGDISLAMGNRELAVRCYRLSLDQAPEFGAALQRLRELGEAPAGQAPRQ